jgi:hypothetical protein
VDRQIAMAVEFGNGALAALSTTIVAQAVAGAWIEGSEGRIELDRELHSVPGFTVTTANGRTRHEHAVEHGYTFMLEHVHECLAAGLTESPLLGRAYSTDVATIFEKVLTQVGVERNLEIVPD